MSAKFLGVERLPSVFSVMPFATETPVHCSGGVINAATYYRSNALPCPLCGDCAMIAPHLSYLDSLATFAPEFARVCGRCHGFAVHAVIGAEVIDFSFRVGFAPPDILAIRARGSAQPSYLPRIVDAMLATIRADIELMKFRAFYRTPDFQAQLYSVPGLGWVDVLENHGMPRMAEHVYYMMNHVPLDDVAGTLVPLFHIDRADVYRYRPLRIFEGPEIET